MKSVIPSVLTSLAGALSLSVLAQGAMAQNVVYRCPDNNFTNAISEKTASERGCKPVDGQITIISSGSTGGSKSAGSSSPRKSDAGGRVEPAKVSGGEKVASIEQKSRDSDARRILESELKAEQEKLSVLLKEYNDGQPERRGDEKNAQKYQDRIADMKASITRIEGNISALKRELNKLPAL